MAGFDAFDRFDTLIGAIAKRASWTPDAIYIEEVGRGALTYDDFHRMLLTWADALRRLGVQSGERVAVLLPPSREAAAAWLSTALLRAIEVPINTDYRGDILRYMLTDSGPTTLVMAARYLDRVAELAGSMPELRTIVILGEGAPPATGLNCRIVSEQEFLADAQPVEGLEPPKPWDILGIQYTGGTTGPSKGVVLPWGSQTKAAQLMAHLGPDDAYYAPFALFHGTGKVPLGMAAFAGGRDVIRERFDTRAFWSDIDRHRCTITTLMPAMGRWLLNQPASPDDRRHTLREAVAVTEIEAIRERFGITIHTFYGQTESGNPICRYDVSDNFRSCGRVRPGFRARIVDAHDYDVPDGEVGELLVRVEEPWVMNLGYFGKPAQTVEVWRHGWIHTGDALRRDADGNYYFVDRVRDYLRRRGENISSFEVEALVLRHPGVAEVAAIAVPSEHGEDELKVVVVRHPGQDFPAEELIRFLIPIMPRFMIPRYVEFMSELPRTVASRNVRKVELRANALNEHTWDREQAGIVLPR
ncbi:MAG: AMP-binding protein [Gammaproteobacteria bacterium]|nr:AMP-binding protein [Gammaproteobacteria bacterium]